MASLPEIFAIQASDAPQHTDHLREILQELETENRIKGFTRLGIDDDLSSISDTLKKDDMILILLTSELEEKREQIKKRVSALKSDQSGLRIAEILVDNLIYDNDYITFPTDLKPIRDRKDMDEAWSSMGKSLRDMFPVMEPEPDPEKEKEPADERETGSIPIPVWVVLAVLAVVLLGWLVLDLVDSPDTAVVSVPDVAGETVDEAVLSLREAGLQIGERQSESNDSFDENLVIRTDPPTGRSVEQGASINLLISLGPEPVEVPDVIGENVVNAIVALQDVGLQIGERQTEPHNTFDENLIVSTNPPAGELVKKESRISLIISTGPERIIEIIGTDDMKFQITEDAEGLVTAGQVGEEFELSQILASPGERLRIILYTRSELPATAMSHNFALVDLGTDIDQFVRESITAADNEFIAPAFEDQVIVVTAILGRGDSETIEFNAPVQPGEYEYACTFPGHFEAGMRGQLIVQ